MSEVKECINCACNDVCSLKKALLKPLEDHERILDCGYYDFMDYVAENCLRYIKKES